MSSPSSVVFSLKELARMEEERVRAHAEAEARERESRDRAERDARERARCEEQARAQAETEARREVERRAREEAARLEAARQAALGAARAEVDARARAQERERERLHELEVARARALERRSGGARVAATLVGAAVAAGVALALHYGVVVPGEEAAAARSAGELAARDVAIADLRARLDASEARASALDDELAAARADAARPPRSLDDPDARLPHRRGAHAPASPAHRTDDKLDGFTSCPPGSQDPLCLH